VISFEEETVVSGANIKVVGVGGAGGNALNNMVKNNLAGVSFIACNTDVQALERNQAAHKVQIGSGLTRGLGAGADPVKGWEAAKEDASRVEEYLKGADMVFVTAGMGGGTGTGAAPVIAQIARSVGALTVGVVTKPFEFEGKPRLRNAEKGLQALKNAVDTLIIIPNQRLLAIANKHMTLLEAFREADNILYNAVKGISDLITIPGLVNVDFADVRTIMFEQGMALMGAGTATGEGRASKAAQQAISSPLLEDTSIDGARGILVNLTGGENLGIMEINEAVTLIQEAAHPDANIIFGAVIDERVGDSIHITVVATGFDRAREDAAQAEAAQVQVQEPAFAAAPAAPPPLPAQDMGDSPFVTVGQPRDRAGHAADARPRLKPWTNGGLNLNDLTAQQKKRSPFSLPADSEFGQEGYPFSQKAGRR
jgi:cell division protein FtsZ